MSHFRQNWSTVLFVAALLVCSRGQAQLSKAEADAFVQQTWQQLSAEREQEMQWETVSESPKVRRGSINVGQHELKCVSTYFGDAPSGQRSLFISMHGGGQAAATVNDQQWRNQVKLYQPEEGFYVAPRAPTDSWNMWHQEHIDQLFSRLIENFVATQGVNPDRIYVMGYSAGGDGVYQLAPRMADRFAAASMMAGHPNDATPDGLRNLPFRIYMGGRDRAYKRNEVAAEWKTKLEDLQKQRGGYAHKVTIYPDSGHWMNLKDAESVPWMLKQNRTAWPKKIVWGKSSVRPKRFYWLECSATDVIFAEVNGQTIEITGCGDEEITLRLHDELLDLDKPITVFVDKKEVWSGKVNRTQESITNSLKDRLDPKMAATASLTVQPADR